MFDQQYQRNPKASEQESVEHEEEESSIGGLSAGLMARGSGGIPLDDGVRAKMESSFGSDFSDVRVHTNSPQAASVGAQAFAHGTELHFAPGAYDPHSSHGQELIGHELAHVVQQRSGRVAPTAQGKGATLGGNASLEHEADVAGAKAARGEPAKVTGTGGGVQFKGPKGPTKQEQARTLLAAARDAKTQQIANECVETLKSRLAAKAELRFTNQDDGQLFTDLEKAASEGVKETVDADTTGATDTQKDDVKAVALKVAQRSKAAQSAISDKSKSLAATFSATHLGAFKAAAEKGYDKTKPSVLTISPKAVVDDAVSAARSAARGIAEAEYQKAKADLDADLQKPANKTAYKTELSANSKAGAKDRAENALATRGAKDAEIAQIANEAQAPHVAKLEAEVLKYLVEGLGANGAHFWRSDELLKFRKDMKTAGRLQARDDIDTQLGAPSGALAGQGGATQRFVGAEAKMGAYDSAKVSVNKVLNEKAKELSGDVMTEWDVKAEATAAARQSAFLVYEDKGKSGAAKTAAANGAKQKIAAMHDDVLSSAKDYKNAVVKPPGGMSTERTEVKDLVKDQVQNKDEVGKNEVTIALKANGPDEGLSKLGNFLDFIVPERGDAVKFKASLEIPAGPGNVLLELQGDAERGGRGRNHEIEKTGTGTSTGTNRRDTASLALGVELRIGYTGSLPGVKLSGALGFFMRSEASDTDKCLKGLSYGVYRFLATKIPPLADIWGGSSSKAQKMSELDGGTKDDNLGDDVYRAELWAAMVEEQVFKKDHTSRVDIGGSANFGTELNAGIFKAKGGLRGELMQTFDHEALKRNVKKDKLKGGHTKIGDDSFDKDGAAERRKALTGRTVGAFQFETEFEFKAAEQTFVVGAKFKIESGGDWSLDLTGGIKVSTGDPAQAGTRLAMGIAGAAHTGIKTIVGVVRNIMDKDHPIAGSVGNVVDGLGRAAISVNDITNNSVGDVISKGTQISSSQHDWVNHEVGDPLAKMSGQDAPTSEYTKAAVNSETMYRFGISMGSNKFLVKIDEVQSIKAQLGTPWSGTSFGGLEYEKSRRVGQIGATMDKNKQKNGKATPGWGFHGEGLGLSHK
jgi:hypothetical protein